MMDRIDNGVASVRSRNQPEWENRILGGCIKCLVLAGEKMDGIRPLLGGVLEKEGGSTPQHLIDALLFLP